MKVGKPPFYIGLFLEVLAPQTCRKIHQRLEMTSALSRAFTTPYKGLRQAPITPSLPYVLISPPLEFGTYAHLILQFLLTRSVMKLPLVLLLANGPATPQKSKLVAGPNVYHLSLDENVVPPEGEPLDPPTRTSCPTKGRITDGMATVRALGGTTIRTHTIGISIGNLLSVMPEPAVVKEAAFEAIDWAVSQAGRQWINITVTSASRDDPKQMRIPPDTEWKKCPSHAGRWQGFALRRSASESRIASFSPPIGHVRICLLVPSGAPMVREGAVDRFAVHKSWRNGTIRQPEGPRRGAPSKVEEALARDSRGSHGACRRAGNRPAQARYTLKL
ncbi:hypothetical protein DL771_011831 [Monosporascus sp. 5C6A]|nr:hypothetical protein DL771_011831 [Monosporascus sp. 5C6A]